jgi:AcrR family transcriptional regulator
MEVRQATKQTKLTQAQRRARTRDKLFRATLEVAADQGFDAVSTRKVAAAAGLTLGAIYAHFEGRDDLLRGALEYYKEHVPALDVPDARSVRDLLCRQMRERLAIADPSDTAMATIHGLQVGLVDRRRTDPQVHALLEEWDASRAAVLAARIREVADAAGERLVVDAELLAEPVMEISTAFTRLWMDGRPELAPEHVALAAMNALADGAVA